MSESAPPKPERTLAVRELAEIVHRRGDIHVRFERTTTGAEGIATQKARQADFGDDYLREHPVALDFEIAEIPWRLAGRIDGCNPTDGLVEEYKTTRADIERMHAHIGHVNIAQLHLYGGLLALEFPDIEEWQLDLCYCHPDSNAVERIGERHTRSQLIAYLNETLDAFRQQILDLLAYRDERNKRLATLPFPFESFRPNQRALAGTVYRALKEGNNLLLEAATGTGKSLATLYPAYRALVDTPMERIFFLTSRTTGQDAAQSASALLEGGGARCVTIIAKEKACLVPGMPCDPEGCEFARGYYDRLSDAVEEGLAAGNNSPEAVKALALKHALCPFELSLDLSRWCDLVIMDYNYVFDPVVRLQRFADASDAIVLVDEAHQLEGRARDMLSVEIAKHEISAVFGKESDAPEQVKKRAKTLARSFTRAANSQLDATDLRFDDVAVAPPKAFTERIGDFVAAVTELGDEAFASDTTSALFFNAHRWQRAQEWLTPDVNARAFYDRRRKVLRLLCLDPSEHIASTLHNYGPNMQFSGTLSPLPLYRRLHGDDEAELARVHPGSLEDRLGLYVVPDVPTHFKARETSLPQLAELVHEVISAREGNYFVAFPSFAYLQQFSEYFHNRYPEVLTRSQERGSDLQQRETFINHFRHATQPTLGLVVLGGVFTESLDFADDALLGIMVVSVALPPPDNAREALADYYRSLGEGDIGQIVAYRQPAMVRVVQAAGRVVRTETDRGIVCLIDGRFRGAEFQALQPTHWQPKTVKASAITQALKEFWAGA